MADAGIQIVWAHCRGALALAHTTACETGLQANQIVMRLNSAGTQNSKGGKVQHLVQFERLLAASP